MSMSAKSNPWWNYTPSHWVSSFNFLFKHMNFKINSVRPFQMTTRLIAVDYTVQIEYVW